MIKTSMMALIILICCVGIKSTETQLLNDLCATCQIQANGKMFIYVDKENSFDSITPFTNGFSIVTSSGYFGVINSAGTQVLPCKYDLIEFAEDCFIIHQNGRKGLSDHNGKILIEPSYSELRYHDGTAAVCYWWSDFGIVDLNDQLIIPMIYENASPFENGWAWIQEKGTYLSNYIDRNGDLLFTDWIIGPASMNDNYAIGQLDYSNSILLNIKTKEVMHYPSTEVNFINNGLILVEGNYLFGPKEESSRTKIKLYDTINDLYITLEYDTIQPFACGLAAVCSKGKWGYINENFEIVIPLKYTRASMFSEERAWVEIDGKKAVIDLQGNVVFYDEENILINSCSYSEGLSSIETKNGWGFINKDGKVVCEPQYRSDSNSVAFQNGFCNLFEDPYHSYYIDHCFQTIIEFDIYDTLEHRDMNADPDKNA